jgi:hypothetical protein
MAYANQGEMAILKKGDQGSISSDMVRTDNGSNIYEVKFGRWVGWMEAKDLDIQ